MKTHKKAWFKYFYYLVPLVVLVALLDHGDSDNKDKWEDGGDGADGRVDAQLQDGDDQEVEVCHPPELLEEVAWQERPDGVLGRLDGVVDKLRLMLRIPIVCL